MIQTPLYPRLIQRPLGPGIRALLILSHDRTVKQRTPDLSFHPQGAPMPPPPLSLSLSLSSLAGQPAMST